MLMGKLTISTVPFSIVILNYQRVLPRQRYARFFTWLSKLKAMVLYVMDSSPYQYEQILSNMDFNPFQNMDINPFQNRTFHLFLPNPSISIHGTGIHLSQRFCIQEVWNHWTHPHPAYCKCT